MTTDWRFQVAPMLSIVSLVWCAVVSIGFATIGSSGVRPGMAPIFLLLLLMPVSFAALGARAAWRGRRVALGVCALLLWVFTVITGFSIGGYYLPATGLLILAAGWAALAGTAPLVRKWTPED